MCQSLTWIKRMDNQRVWENDADPTSAWVPNMHPEDPLVSTKKLPQILWMTYKINCLAKTIKSCQLNQVSKTLIKMISCIRHMNQSQINKRLPIRWNSSKRKQLNIMIRWRQEGKMPRTLALHCSTTISNRTKTKRIYPSINSLQYWIIQLIT